MGSEPLKISYRSGPNEIRGFLFLPRNPESTAAVIICHGAFEFKERYREMGACLAAAGIAALIPDMNGHGESGGARFHVSISRWIEDIRNGIDYLGTREETRRLPTAAFGLSTGGTAVIEAALRESRIKALVLLAPTVRNMMTLAEELTYYAVLPFGVVKKYLTGQPLKIPLPDLMQKKKIVWDDSVQHALMKEPQFLASYLPIPGAHQASIVDTVRRADGIGVPTLVMHGEDDEIDRPESSKIFFEGLRCDKKLILLPETGHQGCVDRHRAVVFHHTAEWIRSRIGQEAGCGSDARRDGRDPVNPR